jgi:GntR family transcriptional regulator
MATERLRRGSAQPLQAQLLERLRADVDRLGVGGRLPTEPEISASYGVSRTTVRRAVQVLVDEGRVVRQQGRGTFVAAGRFAHPLDQIWALVETFTAAGLKPDSEILEYRWLTGSDEVPAEVGEVDGALLVRRLYRVGDQVVGHARAYLPEPFGSRVSRADVEEHPTFQVLQDTLGIAVHHARVTVRSRVADASTAADLQLDAGDPLLVLLRWLYSVDDQLLQYSIYHLPAHVFDFNVEPRLVEPHPVSYDFPPHVPRLTLASEGR